MNLMYPAEILQVKGKRTLNAQLSDICIGTTAAPTYLPAHYFETKDAKGNVRDFHLIDGGVAANNPVSTHKTMMKKSDYHLWIGGAKLPNCEHLGIDCNWSSNEGGVQREPGLLPLQTYGLSQTSSYIIRDRLSKG